MKALRKRYRILATALAVVAAVLTLLVSTRLLYGPAKGLYHRTFRRPLALREPTIEPLSSSFKSPQRQRFLDTYRAGKGSYGLSTTIGSVEGTPIGMTLLVKNGSLTLVRDYTQDSYGIREFAVQEPVRVDLGPVIEEQVHPLSDRFPARGVLFLRCYLPTGEIVYL